MEEIPIRNFIPQSIVEKWKSLGVRIISADSLTSNLGHISEKEDESARRRQAHWFLVFLVQMLQEIDAKRTYNCNELACLSFLFSSFRAICGFTSEDLESPLEKLALNYGSPAKYIFVETIICSDSMLIDELISSPDSKSGASSALTYLEEIITVTGRTVDV
jgi:hypothetical protein